MKIPRYEVIETACISSADDGGLERCVYLVVYFDNGKIDEIYDFFEEPEDILYSLEDLLSGVDPHTWGFGVYGLSVGVDDDRRSADEHYEGILYDNTRKTPLIANNEGLYPENMGVHGKRAFCLSGNYLCGHGDIEADNRYDSLKRLIQDTGVVVKREKLDGFNVCNVYPNVSEEADSTFWGDDESRITLRKFYLRNANTTIDIFSQPLYFANKYLENDYPKHKTLARRLIQTYNPHRWEMCYEDFIGFAELVKEVMISHISTDDTVEDLTIDEIFDRLPNNAVEKEAPNIAPEELIVDSKESVGICYNEAGHADIKDTEKDVAEKNINIPVVDEQGELVLSEEILAIFDSLPDRTPDDQQSDPQ